MYVDRIPSFAIRNGLLPSAGLISGAKMLQERPVRSIVLTGFLPVVVGGLLTHVFEDVRTYDGCLKYGYCCQVDPGLCQFQSFVHTLSNSVQILAFPVIGMERYFSISHPFDKEKHLKRVRLLNGKFQRLRQDLHIQSFLSVLSWAISTLLATATVLLFPTTTVSIYCSRSPLHYDSLEVIFRKIYRLTLPLGIVSVLCTGLKDGFSKDKSSVHLQRVKSPKPNFPLRPSVIEASLLMSRPIFIVVCYVLIVFRVRKQAVVKRTMSRKSIASAKRPRYGFTQT